VVGAMLLAIFERVVWERKAWDPHIHHMQVNSFGVTLSAPQHKWVETLVMQLYNSIFSYHIYGS